MTVESDVAEELLEGKPEVPFVTVSYDEKGRETIQTNLPPDRRPVIYWMLHQAAQIVMTQQSEEEKKVLAGPNGMSGLMRRLSRT